MSEQEKIQELAQELAQRIAARKDIFEYIKVMQATGLLDFKHTPAYHHRIIINELHDAINGVNDKLIVALPPAAAKSTYLSVILPTFLLAKDPTCQILCLSAAESLAENFARRRRAIMRSPEWQKIAQTALAADAQSLAHQGTEKGGSIVCAGCGSTISGLRADYLITDDPIQGFEQANSLPQMDKLWNWYLSEARSRLKPNGKEMVVATRWSAPDLSGRLLELKDKGIEKWRYLRIPMICDDVNDPINRVIGERLWPQWYTKQMVSDAKRDPSIWQTLYQNKPIVESGSWVSTDHIQIKPAHELPLHQNMKIYIGVDIALSIQKGDWTVFSVMGTDRQKSMHVIDLYRKQVDPKESAEAFVEFCRIYSPAACFVDDDNASKVWGRLVDEVAQKRGVAVPLMLVKMGGKDKETRAAPLRSLFLQNRIFIAQAHWNTPLLDEVAAFPHSRHDDVIDAMALPAKELIKHGGAPLKKAPTPLAFVERDNQTYINESLDDMYDRKFAEKHRNSIQKTRI